MLIPNTLILPMEKHGDEEKGKLEYENGKGGMF